MAELTAGWAALEAANPVSALSSAAASAARLRSDGAEHCAGCQAHQDPLQITTQAVAGFSPAGRFFLLSRMQPSPGGICRCASALNASSETSQKPPKGLMLCFSCPFLTTLSTRLCCSLRGCDAAAFLSHVLEEELSAEGKAWEARGAAPLSRRSQQERGTYGALGISWETLALPKVTHFCESSTIQTSTES